MLKNRKFFIILLTFTLVVGAVSSYAQLMKVPIQRTSNAAKSVKSQAGRTKSVTPLTLPFWDDFSFADGDNPKPEYWVDSKTVWVNNGMAINPPSIYVATFDGLDSVGIPYNAQILSNGYRDKLVSAPILMDLPVADRNFVFLSFYYQWQGNGEAPDSEDFLAVEFKDDTGHWIEQQRIGSVDTLQSDKFYYSLLLVSGDKFFHDDFQFRFRTFGRLSGPYDTWNVDYVFLDDHRGPVESFPDRALASELPSILGEYRSIPLKHFRSNPDFQSIEMATQNLSATHQGFISYIGDGYFRNYFYSDTDTTFTDHTAEILPEDGFFINLRERKTEASDAFPDPSDPLQFDPGADAVDIRLKLRLESDDVNDDLIPGLDFTINDTISATYHLHDFYAYDDGTAEQTIQLTRPGNKALVEFEMLTPDPDFLAGFEIYLPDYGIASNQVMDFTVYLSDGDKPRQSPELVINRTVTRQGEGKFFRINFDPTIQVQERFYIGWNAPSIGTPKVGLDVSNNAGDRIFTNTNGTWVRNEDNLNGSVMIRPFFGDGDVVTGIPEEKTLVTIFPNPNKGEFYVKGNFQQLGILSSTGQSIAYRQEDNGDTKRISFNSTPGVYIVRVTAGATTTSKKIIVVP